MGLKEKIKNAKKSDWLTRGLSEEEVKKLVDKALKEIKEETNEELPK